MEDEVVTRHTRRETCGDTERRRRRQAEKTGLGGNQPWWRRAPDTWPRRFEKINSSVEAPSLELGYGRPVNPHSQRPQLPRDHTDM